MSRLPVRLVGGGAHSVHLMMRWERSRSSPPGRMRASRVVSARGPGELSAGCRRGERLTRALNPAHYFCLKISGGFSYAPRRVEMMRRRGGHPGGRAGQPGQKGQKGQKELASRRPRPQHLCYRCYLRESQSHCDGMCRSCYRESEVEPQKSAPPAAPQPVKLRFIDGIVYEVTFDGT